MLLGLLLGAALAPPALAGAATPADGIAGHWRINAELTRALEPVERKSSATTGGFGRPTVAVGGMPIPLPGGQGPQTGLGGSAPDPRIMRCTEVSIAPEGDTIAIDYGATGFERLRRGNDQGRKSRWNTRSLETRYETTTRKVSQEFEIDRDGRLLVTVKLNPDHGRTVTHKRVFDRAEPAPDAP